jgi:hypothetical protein
MSNVCAASGGSTFAKRQGASETMARKWRVAVLGLGHWYSAYGMARAMGEYPDAELVAVAWHDQAQLDAFAGAFGIKAYRDYKALLDQERVDIAFIASRNSATSHCSCPQPASTWCSASRWR